MGISIVLCMCVCVCGYLYVSSVVCYAKRRFVYTRAMVLGGHLTLS